MNEVLTEAVVLAAATNSVTDENQQVEIIVRLIFISVYSHTLMTT